MSPQLSKSQQSTLDSFNLTPEEKQRFARDGYLGPFTLYSTEEAGSLWARVRAGLFDRSAAVYPDDSVSGMTNIANYDRHLDIAELAEHVCRAEITERVQSILGPDLLCWRSEFFPKHPGDEGTDWHQADTFANASGTPQIVWPQDREFGGTITVWTAFTDATEETACLRFIPGTHTAMNYDETKRMTYAPERNTDVDKEGIRRGFFGYDYRELQIDPDWKPDESKAVSVEVRAGQFIIFWSTLMHSSLPHLGKTREMRLAYVSRYVPTSVQVYPNTERVEEYGASIPLDKFGSVLVSGIDIYGYNRLRSHTTRGMPFPIR